MDINIVSRKFMLLTGIDNDELERWLPLLEEAIQYIESILSEEADIEKYNELISSAAGTYAFYKWSLVYRSSSAQSFRAGDVSISAGKSSISEATALQLWKQSLGEISFLIKDNGFFFEGVKV